MFSTFAQKASTDETSRKAFFGLYIKFFVTDCAEAHNDHMGVMKPL